MVLLFMPRVLRNQKTGGSGKRALARKGEARSFPRGKQKPEPEASRVFSESWIPRREKVGRFVGARGFFIEPGANLELLKTNNQNLQTNLVTFSQKCMEHLFHS
ncbi:MAG: hypothetical protein PWP60_1274 [Candidatus Atribacteria bacterium]|nr:hypothetical protein [Candidatus Atribacteria bacterium]